MIVNIEIEHKCYVGPHKYSECLNGDGVGEWTLSKIPTGGKAVDIILPLKQHPCLEESNILYKAGPDKEVPPLMLKHPKSFQEEIAGVHFLRFYYI